MSISRIAAPVLLLVAAAPAWAVAGAPAPQPLDFVMFAGGIAGLFVGRRAASMRRRAD